MVVRNKFDPKTAKVAFRAFAFNGVKFKVGDAFVGKKANASPRQLKALYNARLIEDKCVVKVKRAVKPRKLSREEEFAKAVAEKEAEDNEMIVGKLVHAKASILQQVANVEAEEAFEAQEKADKAKKAVVKKPAKNKPAAKKPAKKAAAKKKVAAKKPAGDKAAPWE